MARSFWCYKLLRVARHPRCSGEDLSQLMHLPHGRHHLQQYSDAFGSRLLVSSPTTVSSLAWRHCSPKDRSGVLAITDTVGISTWRVGATALWITFIEDTATLTYDVHAIHGKTSLCKHRFYMFTWLLCIPNTFIYMSFRAAQDHNKVAGRDLTSSMPSSTRWEDLAATTWCHSFSFAFTCRSFIFAFTCQELYCLELLNLFCFCVS
jgi:hypothetical protein